MPSGRLSLKEGKIGLGKNANLCKIIAVCAKSGVKELILKDVHIIFNGSKLVNQQTSESVISATIQSDENQAVTISEDSAKQALSERIQRDIGELILTDPPGYDRFIEGIIGDAGGGG